MATFILTMFAVNTTTQTTITGATSAYRIKYTFADTKYVYLLEEYQDGSASFFEIYDGTSPLDATAAIASKYIGNGFPTGIYVQGNYAFLIFKSYGLSIWDCTDRSAPVSIGYRTLTTGYYATGIYVSGKYAYLVGTNSSGIGWLQIIDVSTPTAPVGDGYVNLMTGAQSVWVSGKYAYVADGASGVAVVDVTDPGNPSVVTYVTTTGGGVYSIAGSGNDLYVAAGTSGLGIISISTPASPGTPSYVPCKTNVTDVSVSGSTAFVVYHDFSQGGVQTIDITNPSSPGAATVFYDNAATQGVFAGLSQSGHTYAYISTWSAGSMGYMEINDFKPPLSEAALGAVIVGVVTVLIIVIGAIAFIPKKARVKPTKISKKEQEEQRRKGQEESMHKSADSFADEFFKQIESKGLTIDKARALAFVTDFQQKHKKSPTSKDIQIAAIDLAKSEGPAQLQSRIELAITQLDAGQLGSAKTSSDSAQKIVSGTENLDPSLRLRATDLAKEIKAKYDEMRASLEGEFRNVQPLLAEFDFRGAEEALADLKARATAAGIVEVIAACEKTLQTTRESRARNETAQQDVDAVLSLLQSKQLGKAKVIAETNVQKVGTLQDIHPDIRQRILEVRDQVLAELEAARPDLEARADTARELAEQLDFSQAEAIYEAVRSDAAAAEFSDFVTRCDQSLPGVRAAKAVNEDLKQQLSTMQLQFEQGHLESTKIASENLAQKISGMQLIHPDLRQRVMDLRDQILAEYDGAQLALRAEIADAQELISQQNFSDAEATLVAVRSKATAGEFSDIVNECNQRIPVVQKVGKLYRLLSISNRIKIDDVTRVVDIDRTKLLDDLVEWSSMLSGFKIDGDDIVIESEDDLKAFIGKLDESFQTWDKKTETKDGKI